MVGKGFQPHMTRHFIGYHGVLCDIKLHFFSNNMKSLFLDLVKFYIFRNMSLTLFTLPRCPMGFALNAVFWTVFKTYLPTRIHRKKLKTEKTFWVISNQVGWMMKNR